MHLLKKIVEVVVVALLDTRVSAVVGVSVVFPYHLVYPPREPEALLEE